MSFQFTCKICGKTHVSTVRDVREPDSPEVREGLRRELDKFEELANRTPNEQNEKRARDTSFLYHETGSGTGCWKLPDTITTSKDKDGWYFRCTDHETVCSELLKTLEDKRDYPALNRRKVLAMMALTRLCVLCSGKQLVGEDVTKRVYNELLVELGL